MPQEPTLYEAMYILTPDVSEEDAQQVITTLHQHIQNNNGEVEKDELMGRRRLAYEINDYTEGIYRVLYFRGDGSTVDELRHEFSLTEAVIRGMVVVANPDALYEPAEAPVAEPAEEESAPEALPEPTPPPAREVEAAEEETEEEVEQPEEITAAEEAEGSAWAEGAAEEVEAAEEEIEEEAQQPEEITAAEEAEGSAWTEGAAEEVEAAEGSAWAEGAAEEVSEEEPD